MLDNSEGIALYTHVLKIMWWRAATIKHLND